MLDIARTGQGKLHHRRSQSHAGDGHIQRTVPALHWLYRNEIASFWQGMCYDFRPSWEIGSEQGF